MKIRYLFLVFSFLCALLSCNNKVKEQSELLNKEILATHDEVMPKISHVLQLKRQIHQLKDSCEKESECMMLDSLSFGLQQADDDMMHWMHAYTKPEGLDTAIIYLLKQKEEILRVQMQIHTSIENAELYLQSHHEK